jgi:hypothetical protein
MIVTKNPKINTVQQIDTVEAAIESRLVIYFDSAANR